VTGWLPQQGNPTSAGPKGDSAELRPDSGGLFKAYPAAAGFDGVGVGRNGAHDSAESAGQGQGRSSGTALKPTIIVSCGDVSANCTSLSVMLTMFTYSGQKLTSSYGSFSDSLRIASIEPRKSALKITFCRLSGPIVPVSWSGRQAAWSSPRRFSTSL
jgi:hypothetical protein